MTNHLDISYRERQKETEVVRGRKTDKDGKKENEMKGLEMKSEGGSCSCQSLSGKIQFSKDLLLTFLLVELAFIKITSCLEEHTEIVTEKRKQAEKDHRLVSDVVE